MKSKNLQIGVFLFTNLHAKQFFTGFIYGKRDIVKFKK